MKFNIKNGAKLARQGLRPRYNSPEMQDAVDKSHRKIVNLHEAQGLRPDTAVVNHGTIEELAHDLLAQQIILPNLTEGDLIVSQFSLIPEPMMTSPDGLTVLRTFEGSPHVQIQGTIAKGVPATYVGLERSRRGVPTNRAEMLGATTYMHTILIHNTTYAMTDDMFKQAFKKA